jgi:hypothetical protein
LKADGSNAIKCSPDRLTFVFNNGISGSDDCDLNTSRNTNIGQLFKNNAKIGSKLFFERASHFTVEESEVLDELH